MSEAKNENTEAEAISPIYKITRIVLIVALVMFIWYLFADRLTPSTPEARVRAYVIPIVPQVSGSVVQVLEEINQLEDVGDVLIKIDPEPYRIAVDQAEAALQQAGQDVGAGTEAVISAEAKVADAKAQVIYYEQQAIRINELVRTSALAQADRDKAAATLTGGRAKLRSAEAELKRAKEQLGSAGEDNPKIKSAVARLTQAQIDLGFTAMVAPAFGVVTNVQIEVGQYGRKGQPLMTFISTRDVWVEAYMRENNLGNMKRGDPVEMVLDIAPGEVFSGKVANASWGISFDNNNSTGRLPRISASSG